MSKRDKKDDKNDVKKHSIVVYKYFNNTSVPTDIEIEPFLLGMVDRAEEILKEYGLPVKIWNGFDIYRSKIIEAWINDPIGHKYWWMDKYIDEIGFMIWNKIFEKYHSEWYRTGILVDVPELTKRERNGEGIATYLANMIVKKFIEPYL